MSNSKILTYIKFGFLTFSIVVNMLLAIIIVVLINTKGEEKLSGIIGKYEEKINRLKEKRKRNEKIISNLGDDDYNSDGTLK